MSNTKNTGHVKKAKVKLALTWPVRVLSSWLSVLNPKQVNLPNIEKPQRRKVDNDAIRCRIKAQGWNLLELPVRKNHPDSRQQIIVRWKIIASRGDKSLEVGGLTIDEALKNVGETLGVIAKEK